MFNNHSNAIVVFFDKAHELGLACISRVSSETQVIVFEHPKLYSKWCELTSTAKYSETEITEALKFIKANY